LKLDWRKTFLIGLGFFGISVVLTIYNSYVPIFLQAGRGDFETSGNVLGFGLNKQMTGVVMGLDNLAAIFVLPMIGVWSDRVRTPFGRRYPFILTAAPLVTIGFILLPTIATVARASIPENLAFPLFMSGNVLVLISLAVMRTPIISLMPDVTPSALRSKANGVINLMGGLGIVVATLGLSLLFDVSPLLPFAGAAAIMVSAFVLLFFTVKEPDVNSLPHPEAREESEQEQALGALKLARTVPPHSRRSLGFLLLAILFCFIAHDGLGTFFTSYAINVLKFSEGQAPQLFTVIGLGFLLFAIPAGFMGVRVGRRKTIILGLSLFSAFLLIGYFLNSPILLVLIFGLCGASWSLVNINTLPMVVDTSADERLVGTYIGLYYLASQTGSALAPLITATFIDLLGGSFRNLFLSGPMFFMLALVAILFVTRGEAHQTQPALAAAD
jgi:maltose/moltooligosaccharide transporter